MRVGLGTGSTARHAILALAERRPRIVCVATSIETHELAVSLGLEVVAPDDLRLLDLAIDGADEVDPTLNLIKGGGGAHTREKIVARMAARFLVAVDASKLVPTLGACGLPVEVLPFAPEVVAARLLELGASAVTRRERSSDGGNVLMDARFGLIADPVGLAAELDAVPGLVEHGLFPGSWVERVIVAEAGATRELTARR